ncbi:MAG TPA: hypothetical protein DEA73_08130 [Peptococcaceae bacterium]|nr:hypothetical protein [Peptococcaceae bacterium]
MIVVLLGAAASLGAVAGRVRLEGANRTVTVAVDYREVAKLARWTGLTEREVLGLLGEKGVNAVLFKEDTIRELSPERVRLYSGDEAAWLFPRYADRFRAGFLYFFLRDLDVLEQIKGQLEHKLPAPPEVISTPDFMVVGIPFMPQEELEALGLGFPRNKLREVADQGFLLLVQVRSWPQATEESLGKVLEPLQPFRPYLAAVLFNDKVLPGFPEALPALAAEIRQLGAPVGLIEFNEQQGLKNLALLMDKKALRLHAIPPERMFSLSPEEGVARFTLAATERNVRLLFVRLFFRPDSSDWLADNLSYLEDLRASLAGEGLVIGRAEPFPAFKSWRLLWFLAGVGVIAGGILLLESLGFGRWGWALGILGCLGWLGAGLLGYGYGLFLRKVMALGAAVVFPTLALWSALVGGRSSGPIPAAKVILRSTFVSFLGGLLIAGLLSETAFMLQLDQFTGVKAAFVLPLLIFGVGAIYREEKDNFWPTVKGWLQQNLTVLMLLILAAAAAAFVVYLSRSGNQSIGLLPLEGQVRLLLDGILGVRPRFKEFLLGYPAFLWALMLPYRHRFLPLWLLALTGQISVVNTFCHIHTPLVVSLVRTVNGLWVGLLVGMGTLVVAHVLKVVFLRCFGGSGR